jgi:MFS transporter, SP family, arabinose:H+ symporter
MRNYSSSSRFKYLVLICAVAALGGFLFGFDTAVISGVVGFVKGEFSMSSLMEGWFVSSALLGCIIGVIFAGKLSDSYGRKKVLLLSALLFTIAAAGCMTAQGDTLLITFRLIGGLGIGVASMVSPLYISEFSPAQLRGRMVTLYQLAITIGILCAYFSNAGLLKLPLSDASGGLGSGNNFLHWIIREHVWRGMFGMGLIPAIFFLICLFFVPESPRWLVMMNHDKMAEKLLQKVNTAEIAQTEIIAIKASFTNEKKSLKELFSPVYRIALVIGLLLPFLSQLSGINAVIYYGPEY